MAEAARHLVSNGMLEVARSRITFREKVPNQGIGRRLGAEPLIVVEAIEFRPEVAQGGESTALGGEIVGEFVKAVVTQQPPRRFGDGPVAGAPEQVRTIEEIGSQVVGLAETMGARAFKCGGMAVLGGGEQRGLDQNRRVFDRAERE